jgi:hypothetical protein
MAYGKSLCGFFCILIQVVNEQGERALHAYALVPDGCYATSSSCVFHPVGLAILLLHQNTPTIFLCVFLI